MAWCLPYDGSIEFKAAVFLGDLSRKISIIAILFYALSFRLVFRLLIMKRNCFNLWKAFRMSMIDKSLTVTLISVFRYSFQ